MIDDCRYVSHQERAQAQAAEAAAASADRTAIEAMHAAQEAAAAAASAAAEARQKLERLQVDHGRVDTVLLGRDVIPVVGLRVRLSAFGRQHLNAHGVRSYGEEAGGSVEWVQPTLLDYCTPDPGDGDHAHVASAPAAFQVSVCWDHSGQCVQYFIPGKCWPERVEPRRQEGLDESKKLVYFLEALTDVAQRGDGETPQRFRPSAWFSSSGTGPSAAAESTVQAAATSAARAHEYRLQRSVSMHAYAEKMLQKEPNSPFHVMSELEDQATSNGVKQDQQDCAEDVESDSTPWNGEVGVFDEKRGDVKDQDKVPDVPMPRAPKPSHARSIYVTQSAATPATDSQGNFSFVSV